MKVTRRHALAAGIGGAFSTLSLSSLRAEFDGPLARGIDGGEDFWLATDAYIYGYPLVTMEMTRRVMTNVATPRYPRPDGAVLQAALSQRRLPGRHRSERRHAVHDGLA